MRLQYYLPILCLLPMEIFGHTDLTRSGFWASQFLELDIQLDLMENLSIYLFFFVDDWRRMPCRFVLTTISATAFLIGKNRYLLVFGPVLADGGQTYLRL